MDSFLGRYRNLSVLLLLVAGQLMLLAWQIRSSQDVPLIRVWAVAAVTPLARAVEAGRVAAASFFSEYFVWRGAVQENRELKRRLGQLQLRNHFLEAELASAERAQALAQFRARIPSKTLAVRVIGAGAGPEAHTVFIDRGSSDGVMKGMAAITPEGIAGKVIAAYPMSAMVQLITAPGAVAGVVTQKLRLRGALRGTGSGLCLLEHIDSEAPLEPGEWIYTSGADRVFPRGLPAGQVKLVREGRAGREILVEPSGLKTRLDELVIVLDGVHGMLPPPGVPPSDAVSLLPPPPPEPGVGSEPPARGNNGALLTDADRLAERYRRMAEAQGVQLGSKGRVPDFTREPAPAAPNGRSAPPSADGGAPKKQEPPRP
ncbi:MAG: rod shape-determining protein MreC [Bryobacteraceae bacterium]|nr:rod shape-determining protein MreC [Bryobacteraceae bacterium]